MHNIHDHVIERLLDGIDPYETIRFGGPFHYFIPAFIWMPPGRRRRRPQTWCQTLCGYETPSFCEDRDGKITRVTNRSDAEMVMGRVCGNCLSSLNHHLKYYIMSHYTPLLQALRKYELSVFTMSLHPTIETLTIMVNYDHRKMYQVEFPIFSCKTGKLLTKNPVTDIVNAILNASPNKPHPVADFMKETESILFDPEPPTQE